MICWLMKSLLSQVAIYRHLFPLPDAKAAYLYPASFILYTRVAKRTTYFAREHNTMTQPEIAPQTSEAESTPQPLGHLASQEQEEQIITPDLFVLWINTGSSSFKVAVNIFCITGASFVGIYPVLTWREIEKKMKIKERKEKRKGMILVTSVSEQDLIHVLQCSHGL